MKCEATECGRTEGGLRVSAITDVAGAQVVVRDDQSLDSIHLLSKPLASHASAVALGKEIVEQGVDIYSEWGSPLGMFEVACLSVTENARTT